MSIGKFNRKSLFNSYKKIREQKSHLDEFSFSMNFVFQPDSDRFSLALRNSVKNFAPELIVSGDVIFQHYMVGVLYSVRARE